MLSPFPSVSAYNLSLNKGNSSCVGVSPEASLEWLIRATWPLRSTKKSGRKMSHELSFLLGCPVGFPCFLPCWVTASCLHLLHKLSSERTTACASNPGPASAFPAPTLQKCCQCQVISFAGKVMCLRGGPSFGTLFIRGSYPLQQLFPLTEWGKECLRRGVRG